MCAGINCNNWHQNILRMLFGNTHAHNICRMIGRSERSWFVHISVASLILVSNILIFSSLIFICFHTLKNMSFSWKFIPSIFFFIIYCVRIKLYSSSISRYINISDSVADSVIFINFVTASIRFCFSTSVKLFSSVSLFVLYVICL